MLKWQQLCPAQLCWHCSPKRSAAGPQPHAAEPTGALEGEELLGAALPELLPARASVGAAETGTGKRKPSCPYVSVRDLLQGDRGDITCLLSPCPLQHHAGRGRLCSVPGALLSSWADVWPEESCVLPCLIERELRR